MKVLLYDIETSPAIGAYFDRYKEDNIVWTVQGWYMLSFAFKWLGDKKTHVRALPDYSLYSEDQTSDLSLVQDLWGLFQEADIIVAHNGDKFDLRKSNARFIAHGLDPVPPFKTIDTLKVAKKYFKFESNRLDALGEYLGVGRKLQTGGLELWRGCMSGDKSAWNKMKRYNKQDVDLLEAVYNRLSPWMHTHPNLNLIDELEGACPACKSTKLQKRGFGYTTVGKYQRYQCECGKWSKGPITRTSVVIR